jgi:YidC/Oxa1 family membrane protein insertase
LDNRLVLTIVLAVALIFAYQELVIKRLYPPTPEAGRATMEAMPNASASSAHGVPSPAVPAGTALVDGGSLAELKSAPGMPRSITIETDLYIAQVSTAGGRLVSFRLKKYRENTEPGSPLYEMVKPWHGGAAPLALLLNGGHGVASDAGVIYATDSPASLTASDGGSVTLKLVGKADGLILTKTFTFKNGSYVFDLSADVSGASADAVRETGVSISRSLVALEGYADVPELEADVGGKVTTENEKALRKGVAAISGPITFAGFGDRYFLSVFMPQQPPSGTLQMEYSNDQAHARLLFNDAHALKTAVYMGPKELDILEAVNPALSKSIDFGIMGVIALPFLRALKLFYRIVPNYGVAIILLTVVVRLLTLPMSIKGQRSMMRMQRLQPQIERIRERYKNDQERLNREMMDLYKRNHVNPIGGCLPMLVQLPILWGLYEALLNSIELRQAPFIGWIRDLSAPDCLQIPGMPELPWTHCHGIPVLVVLLAVSSLAQQWLAPRQPDPSQQKMMMYMPLIFSFIFISLPSGLTLYYLASNLLGIVQQVFLNYEFRQYAPVTT